MSTPNEEGLMVIGAALGRTGTMSMQAALKILGFDGCYHFAELIVSKNSGSSERFINLIEKKLKLDDPLYEKLTEVSDHEWDIIFKGYKATVDEPAALFYKELMDRYPNAKVVLTVRDNSAKWYKSYKNLYEWVFAADRLWFVNLFWKDWRMSRYLSSHMITTLKFGDDYKKKLMNDPKYCQNVYEQWNKNVIDYVPKDRLLVFNVKQGWEPLCKFLNIEKIPNEPFPHLNESKQMAMATKWSHIMANVVNCGVVIGISIGAYKVYNKYFISS